MINSKNKLTLKTKSRIKEVIVLSVVVTLFSIVAEMDYQDEINQANYNCSFATYAADNAQECK